MLLGNRGARIERLGRCLAVWASGTATLAVAAGRIAPSAGDRWAARRSWDRLPLDVALVDLAEVVLVVGAVWVWLALTVTVGEALLGSPAGEVPRSARPWRLPSGLRQLVLTGCGVALVSTLAPPALASGHHPRPARGAAALTGLPLPERAVASPAPPTAPRRTTTRPAPSGGSVVVRAGDCLWSIATRGLPPTAPAAAVTRRWHAIYAANRRTIGPDPNLVQPGQRLVLPRPQPRRDP